MKIIITSQVLLIAVLVFLIQSCSKGPSYSCDQIGKKTSADNPSREELAWFAKNCLNQ